MKKQILTIVFTIVFFATGSFAAPEKGETRDSRDGKTYKTVKIGNQTWMAENLNYETQNSFCYEDDLANCKKYGRLYTKNDAIYACPVGWHLPSNEEFETLLEAVGGSQIAGIKLKSKIGWNSNGNGTDAYGFTALPAGQRTAGFGGIFRVESETGCFWSSTELDSFSAYDMCIDYCNDFAGLYEIGKQFALSVRCLKD